MEGSSSVGRRIEQSGVNERSVKDRSICHQCCAEYLYLIELNSNNTYAENIIQITLYSNLYSNKSANPL
jgi:hypothetical protein